VTLHVPMLPETKNLIDAGKLALMKNTALLINTSRGGVIDETALVEALTKKNLGGCALDVFEVEKAFPLDHPLLSAPNLILTPHLGASTREAQINVSVDVAQQIRDTLNGGLPTSAVNLAGIRPQDLFGLHPLLNCCTIMGRVAAQILDGPLVDVICTVEGRYAEEKGELLLMAVANGALGTHGDRSVNFVNVRHVAETHKIKLSLVKEETHTKSAVLVTLKGASKSASLRGTVMEDGQVLLKSFMNVPIFMRIPSNASMFYSKHLDRPGALGRIAGCLGGHNYNIASCHLGRVVPKGTGVGEGEALCIFHIDGALTKEVLADIKAISEIKEVKSFRA